MDDFAPKVPLVVGLRPRGRGGEVPGVSSGFFNGEGIFVMDMLAGFLKRMPFKMIYDY